MTTRTPESALKQYRLVLNKLAELEAKHTAETEQLKAAKAKIRSFLAESGHEGEVHEWLVEADPALAWVVSEKSDGLAVRLHMKMDDEVIPKLKNEYESVKKQLEAGIESIEKWGLAQMLERGSKGFKSAEGSAQLRTDVKYQIADKKLFVDWAVENNAQSELTITLRPNSKFMASVVESQNELPKGVSSFREQKCVFVKG